jgi:putative protease
MLAWENELRKIKHRDYTTGSLDGYALEDSIYNQRENDDNDYVVSGIVLESIPNSHTLVDVKSAFYKNDTLEIMPFCGPNAEIKLDFVKSISGIDVEKSKPGSVVKIPYVPGVEKFNLIRKSLKEI